MKKISDKNQQFLLQLMKSCECYHLNEKQPVECINNILHRNIFRRSQRHTPSLKQPKVQEEIWAQTLEGPNHFSALTKGVKVG